MSKVYHKIVDEVDDTDPQGRTYKSLVTIYIVRDTTIQEPDFTDDYGGKTYPVKVYEWSDGKVTYSMERKDLS